MDYRFKTTPRRHQQDDFDRFSVDPGADGRVVDAFALWHEQRCGKSKIVIDLATFRYLQRRVDAVLIVAWPAGVHRNWVTDEFPAHCPLLRADWSDVRREFDLSGAALYNSSSGVDAWAGTVWRSDRVGRRAYDAELAALLEFPGLAVLAVNAEALVTEKCKDYLRRFMRARRVFVCADEADFMSTPGAGRTKVMIGIGKCRTAVVKCVASGTPTESGPLDMYALYSFLDPRVLGYTSFFAYSNHFAEWEQRTNYGDARTYRVCVGFKNLDEFVRLTAPYSSRVLRHQVSDAPPKTYQKAYFALTAEQRRVYDRIDEEHEAELRDGRTVTASMVLTRYLRLQQVCSNYYPGEAVAEPCAACSPTAPDAACRSCYGAGWTVTCEPATVIDSKRNPRLDRLEHELRVKMPTIVWSRFRPEVDEICARMLNLGWSIGRYDGSVTADEKAWALRAFARGEVDAIVGNQSAGGRGVKMATAERMIYVTNQFGLRTRLQSEDRAEDLSKATSTLVVDLVAEDTKDEEVIAAFRDGKSVADAVLGDERREWV